MLKILLNIIYIKFIQMNNIYFKNFEGDREIIKKKLYVHIEQVQNDGSPTPQNKVVLKQFGLSITYYRQFEDYENVQKSTNFYL